MNKISKISAKSFITATGSSLMALVYPAIASGMSQLQAGALAARASDQPLSLFGAAGIFTTISNTAMFLIGALCVLMLVFGGFRYVISGGDAAKVTAAKNTILYAIVGVVVATMAYAAIDFVTTTLANGGAVVAGGTNV